MSVKGVILILLTCALSGMAVEEGFKRYQIIIDKHPFGEEPPEADVVQIPLNQSFARHLRLSMLLEGSGGEIRAGIIDSQDPKKIKDFTLKIGEIREGLELIEADMAAEEAVLRKGNEVALFKLKSAAPEPLTKKQQSSYAQRKRARQAIAQKRAEPQKPVEPQLTGEALRIHLEGVQMDAIRNNLPPLPLPLTKEMDDQLVAEGVLDPQ